MAELTITGLGRRGEGVAELDGKPLFVPFTLPGERAEVAIEGDRATLVTLLAASPERSEPFCPHFGSCGGCQLQHLGPKAYAEFKTGLVTTALERAGISALVGTLVDARGRGRRRAVMHARREGAGFMHMRSHQVHDLDHCPILVPALAKAADIARAALGAIGECDVSFTATLTGLDVAIRAERKGLRAEKLAPLTQKFDLARLALNGEIVLQQRVPLVQMGKAQVELPIGSFLQATEAAEQILADRVIALAGKAKHVADLFCGLGPFALRLAETARVTAHDSDKGGIAALLNAVKRTQGLKPLAAKPRDLFRDPLTRFEFDPFDCVVVDPPRAGAEAQVREIAASRLKHLVYVSCDPQSFARDAAILLASGFKLGPITPVDQFAWSTHVELVADFTH